ncbi:hypothetical protein RRG08_067303 [Elysia crispata]|uniref:Uncharacterized protein n=1 Tax=Elysia crispata TaxID=231223 RepID=A0AAE0ZBF1_9GAST|nr:hypothetical protein RRG08_067303 [Elysia crispata]
MFLCLTLQDHSSVDERPKWPWELHEYVKYNIALTLKCDFAVTALLRATAAFQEAWECGIIEEGGEKPYFPARGLMLTGVSQNKSSTSIYKESALMSSRIRTLHLIIDKPLL